MSVSLVCFRSPRHPGNYYLQFLLVRPCHRYAFATPITLEILTYQLLLGFWPCLRLSWGCSGAGPCHSKKDFFFWWPCWWGFSWAFGLAWGCPGCLLAMAPAILRKTFSGALAVGASLGLLVLPEAALGVFWCWPLPF